MSQQPPRVFIVLRNGIDCDCEHDVAAVAATISPYEAQDFLDSGSDIVEALPMPPELAGFVQNYIDRHHSEEPFIKRQRGPRAPEKQVFVAQGAAPVERRKGKKRL